MLPTISGFTLSCKFSLHIKFEMPKHRSNKIMSQHIDGHGKIMCNLPGSEAMVGGPHLCMYHILDSSLSLGDWSPKAVYMHVARQKPKVYLATECRAVLDGINLLNQDHAAAASALLHGTHIDGHPLPGVYTVFLPSFRIDYRMYPHNGNRHLWAELYHV